MSEFTEETATRKRELRQRTDERTQKPGTTPERPSWVSGLHATTGNRSVSRVLSATAPLGGRKLSPDLNNPAISRMIFRLAAQRMGEMAEEEELQAKHTDAAIAQRAGEMTEEEDELAQAKHTDAAIAQRAGEMTEEEDELQAKHTDAAIAQRAEFEEDELAQAKHESPTLGSQGGTLDDDAAGRIESQRGGGSGLSPDIQTKMEGHFGADFSSVRVHQDSEADSLAAGMSARAFTTGSDVFLRQSERAGDTNLMAHELAHVVQQTSGVASGTQNAGLSVGASDDPLEVEADREAAALNAGAPSRLVAEDADHQH